jgi:hypothetical protein
MARTVTDIELSEALPALAVGPGEDGLALLVRRRGRPLAFVLRERPPGPVEPEALARFTAEEAGRALLREALVEELGGEREATAPAEHTTRLVPGAQPDPGWDAALAEALAEQPDAAVVAGPAVPRAIAGPDEAAAELALAPRFEKLRIAPGGGVPGLPAVRTLAAAGGVAIRPGLELPGAAPADVIASALRAGLTVAYEPGLLARTPGGRDQAALLAEARLRGAAVVAILAALGAAPARRIIARRRTARWVAREGRRLLRADTRARSAAELRGALGAR